MNNEILKNILKEYNIKKAHAEKEAQDRKLEIFSSSKELQDIEDELNRTAISISKNILLSGNNSTEELTKLENSISSLKKEKENLLTKLGISADDIMPKYECMLCKDTGFLTENSSNEMCTCLRQKLLDIAYNNSNLSDLKNNTFDKFNLNFYSNEIDEKSYASKISPRDNINFIKNLSIKFIDNFDNPDEKNLIFIGNTGLGKTFLSNCIANELLKKGKTVLYQTAPVLLDLAIDYKFNKNNVLPETYKNIFDVDLLIIDDLGTENMNSIKFAELFTIINTRLLNQNNKITKTIISTNLSIKNLFDTYDERIISRIVGNYNICKFFGQDIRFLSK